MGRPRGEIAFGSDSFLDIVANLVGILIILTVVAGLRVSQAPVATTVDAPPKAAVVPPPPAIAAEPQPAGPAPVPPEPFEPETLFPPVAIVHEPKMEPVAAPVPPRVAPLPSPGLLGRIAALQSELAALQRNAVKRSERLRDVAAQEQALRGRLGEHRDALAAAQNAEQDGERLLRELHGRVTDAQVQLRNVEAELEQARRQPGPVTALRHRMTPLARTVRGTEYHFQLTGGRVAHIPVEELVERIKSQMVRQKDWLLKFPRHQGVVGPVGGFSMEYIVERDELSFAERMRAGYGTMRISVSRWTLQAEPDLAAETLDEALHPGSAFIRVLREADLDATLTFWVYPDSFGEYRQLAEACHREGFTVAARPMPFGVSIAGSPSGSRSAGQ